MVLRKLSFSDDKPIFDMLKQIDAVENSYTNPVHDMSYQQFKDWVIQQEQWSEGKALPEGYVPQTIYWLFDNDRPVGMGKIRHELTEASRTIGGNIGYAISKPYRGLGYGTEFLRLLLIEAHKMNLDEILLTVDKNNIASKKVCEKNNGIIIDENDERWFFKFD